MIDITAKPNSEFGLSPADRKSPAGPWLHSFLGTIVFGSADKVIQEDNVPIIFLLSSIIESTLLVTRFRTRLRTIPMPSTEREIRILGEKDYTLLQIIHPNLGVELEATINDETIATLFNTITGLMKTWQAGYLDDKYFVRSNWMIGAALDLDASATPL